MRFFKGTKHYVVAVSSRKVEQSYELTVSMIPQNLDVWAWEKYYKQEPSITTSSTHSRPLVEIHPTQSSTRTVSSSTGRSTGIKKCRFLAAAEILSTCTTF